MSKARHCKSERRRRRIYVDERSRKKKKIPEICKDREDKNDTSSMTAKDDIIYILYICKLKPMTSLGCYCDVFLTWHGGNFAHQSLNQTDKHRVSDMRCFTCSHNICEQKCSSQKRSFSWPDRNQTTTTINTTRHVSGDDDDNGNSITKVHNRKQKKF
ncbi:hypothetical protein DINM_004228 [Dirofilaria immitis]|nr:hypothetical protein [Dirofilaria immitis]